MPVKTKDFSPARRSRTLKPQHHQQEAAIAEIEAILNMEEIEVRSQKLEVKKRPEVKKETARTKNHTPASSSFKETEQSLPRKKKVNFLAVNNSGAHSPYLLDLKKQTEDKARQNAQRKKQYRPALRLPSFHIPRPYGKILSPASKPQIIAPIKYAQGFQVGRLIDWYRRYEHILGQLLLVNVLLLAGYVVGKPARPVYRLGKVMARYAGYTLHDIALFIESKAITSRLRRLGYRLTVAPVLALGKAVSVSAEMTAMTGSYLLSGAAGSARHARLAGQASWQETVDSLRQARLPVFALRFLPPHSWQRSLAGFIVLAILLVLPLKAAHYSRIFQSVKGSVLGESEAAFTQMQSALNAGGEFNFAQAQDNFSAASVNFSNAGTMLTDYADVIHLARLLPGKKAKAALAVENLLSSAEHAAGAGSHLSAAFAGLQLPYLAPQLVASELFDEPAPLTVRLERFSAEVDAALADMEKFAAFIKAVDTDSIAALPIAQADAIVAQVASLQEKSDSLVAGTRTAAQLARLLGIFLGHEQDARYLLIFQNNAELRASGGFIGSYALVDFRQGAIKQLEVPTGGSYDLQGGLHARIASPKPLHLINSLWEFQDANWWPDWPRSAQQIELFFENGWGSSVDGVIAIDPTFIEELLAILGPIDLTARYGTVVTFENFYEVAQNRDNLRDVNQPKEIIRDLVEAVTAELPNRLTLENLPLFIGLLERSLAEKHILLNVHDTRVQDFIAAHGWDGRLLTTTGDYLAVINTNIAGAKTDRKIRQSIAHTAEVTPDGSIINTVEITREHTAGKGEPYAGVRNVNYLRLYVPYGSTLMEASGFAPPDLIYFDEPVEGAVFDPDIELAEKSTAVDADSGVQIYNEFGKTVFGHWTQVDPGQTLTIRFKYKLPFKIHSVRERQNLVQSFLRGNYELNPYSLLVQKQAGTNESNFSSSLRLPSNMTVVADLDSPAVDAGARGWRITDNLRTDRYWGAVIKKNNN